MAFYFAAALPVVVVFYLLKRKRIVKLISSTMLWEKFLAESQASAPFQKLRHNWLLILQLLLLIFLIFALARPYWAGESGSKRLRVVILDASASMQSKDVNPSRFEQGREEALKWVDGLRDYDQMVLLLAGSNTEVKQSATSDKTALRRALRGAEVTDGPTRLVEAFKLAETLVRNQPDAEIHLFSDGALPNLEDFENRNLPLVYHKIGEGGKNLGLVSMDVRANPENAAERAVFASVMNFSRERWETEVELSFNDELLEVRLVDLGPTNSVPLVFLVPQTKDGVFTVRLRAEDDLEVDNEVSMVSLMPSPVKALLVTQGNRFLEKALRGPGNVELRVAPFLSDDGSGYDLVVLDDVLPAVWPRVNTMAIHVATTNWFAGWEVEKAPLIVDWRNTHPLLRFVSFDDVSVNETLRVKTPGWGISLVESPRTALIIAGEFERKRVMWIGFDVLQSSWPMRRSFPIFMANAVEWLNPANANVGQLMVRAGDPFRLGLTEGVERVEVTGPDGLERVVELEPGAGELVVGETSRRGKYRIRVGTNEVMFCVNLLDGRESDIQPREELPFGKYGKVEATTMVKANVEYWRWIALAGLMVLLFEWWYYHRRTA